MLLVGFCMNGLSVIVVSEMIVVIRKVICVFGVFVIVWDRFLVLLVCRIVE